MNALSFFKFMCLTLFFGLTSIGVSADEGKNEARGKDEKHLVERDEGRKEYRHDDTPRDNYGDRSGERGQGGYFREKGYANQRIPNGHLPPPGECRIWYPDRPAGQQPPPFKCGQGRRQVEPGGWLMSPGRQPQEVEVAVYDQRRPGVVIDVGIFDARTGSMIRIGGNR